MFGITVKAFPWENHGTYLIVVARGELNNESAREILRRVDEATLNHRGCKILIDLHEITAFLNSADLDEVSVQAAPSFEENKIVFCLPVRSLAKLFTDLVSHVFYPARIPDRRIL